MIHSFNDIKRSIKMKDTLKTLKKKKKENNFNNTSAKTTNKNIFFLKLHNQHKGLMHGGLEQGHPHATRSKGVTPGTVLLARRPGAWGP